jgi:hypothetical protein
VTLSLQQPLLRWRAGIRRVRRAIAAIVPGIFENALFFGGLAAIAYGCWMIYKPLGPIVGGVFAVKVAFLIAAERK